MKNRFVILVTYILHLVRPTHWIKNAFVLAGVFFSGDWRQFPVVAHSLLAFAAFCFAASAVYCWNDALDAEKDREHPRKKFRPVAAGEVSPKTAGWVSGVLILCALILSLEVDFRLTLALTAYLLINAFYSGTGKNRVLIDVFCIASGFILRLLAGTWGIGIEPSQWFLLCTFALSLFLGFSKRYAELTDPHLRAEEKRQVLKNYSPEFLQILLSVTLSATIITYGLYTTSPRTVQVHGTEHLIYTVPLAMFGMFRYLYLVMRQGFGENTVADIFKDKQMILVSILYLLTAGGFLFFGSVGGFR